MLSFPAAIKVYLCTVPCDMRRSFDGLSSPVVRNQQFTAPEIFVHHQVRSYSRSLLCKQVQLCSTVRRRWRKCTFCRVRQPTKARP